MEEFDRDGLAELLGVDDGAHAACANDATDAVATRNDRTWRWEPGAPSDAENRICFEGDTSLTRHQCTEPTGRDPRASA